MFVCPVPRFRFTRRFCSTILLVLLSAAAARADVYGRLGFTVQDANTQKPIAGATIRLQDTANIHPNVELTTDANGTATSAPLEIRPWGITTTADGYNPDTRQLSVSADTTTPVTILLQPQKVQVINITGSKVLVQKGQTANVTPRGQQFLQTFPATGGNQQSLQQFLLTAPGFVQDSVNQAHPRGEHSSTTIFLDGFELPDALQGRAGQLLVPDIIENAQIMTGGYAPEYGGETAAILNLSLRAGTIKPFVDFTLDGGTYSTIDGIVTFGGQLGPQYGLPDANGARARRLGYLVSLNTRSTANALEPPQPYNQTAHNSGVSSDFFGNFDYTLGTRDKLTLAINSAPASTDIANRTGLPDEYSLVGQGFGFGGARSADGTIPGVPAGSLGSQTIVLPSQQDAGQGDSQNDNNTFGRINYRHGFSDQLTGLFGFGVSRSDLTINNNNPMIDLSNLPVDNSIEYNPYVSRQATDEELIGSLTLAKPKHTIKGGFVYDLQHGTEAYQFIPGSQLALDALNNVGVPGLLPDGSVEMAAGMPVVDALGNPIYQLTNPATAASPTLNVSRNGHYAALYVQDTWNVTRLFTANYGLRLDDYRQNQNLGFAPVKDTVLSPRVNLAYEFIPRTIGRVSYNHLFTAPPLAQGAIIGEGIQTEIIDQYEASVERQLSAEQVAKVSYYYKHINNQIDTGLLIPFTQIGAYTSVNFAHGAVHGLELTYELTPKNNIGTAAYVSYAYSIAAPNGFTNNDPTAPAPTFNDHDQRHTLSTGISYTEKNGAQAAADLYYGSGVTSSILAPITTTNPNVLNNGDRIAHTDVNLRLKSPTFDKHYNLVLNVANLLNDRSVINFNSGFSGTRFDQGLRATLGVTGKF
ncbi:MAG TPA: TonB-dependent receptor [Armatimonadota bacterium]|nr:TonB-dependent receptor [Armatimonadota bacterium]